MDISYLILGLIFISIGLSTLIELKLVKQTSRTWLGQKPWPVKLRRRVAIGLLLWGLVIIVVDLLAWMGLVKL